MIVHNIYFRRKYICFISGTQKNNDIKLNWMKRVVVVSCPLWKCRLYGNVRNKNVDYGNVRNKNVRYGSVRYGNVRYVNALTSYFMIGGHLCNK